MSLHFVFHCTKKDCESPILLRVEMLEQLTVPRGRHSIDFDSIGVVCPRCKLLGSYSLRADSPNFDPTGKAVDCDQTSNPCFAGWLKCAVESCETRLPIFSLTSISIDPTVRHKELSTWKWEGLQCASGNPIPKPDKPWLIFDLSSQPSPFKVESVEHLVGWYRVTINAEDLKAGKLDTIRVEFRIILEDHQEPNGAAIYQANESGITVIYFSDEAKRISKNLIDRYHGIECPPPLMLGLTLLEGTKTKIL